MAPIPLSQLIKPSSLPPRDSLPQIPPINGYQLFRRQTSIVAVPTTYGNLDSGPTPGVVAGIVLGSVAGFLLILWILSTIFGSGGGYGNFGYNANDNVSSVVILETTTRKRSRNRRPSRRVQETIIRESRGGGGAPPVVIVEETRRTSRGPAAAVSEDDEVVVIEERSPAPRDRQRDRERRKRDSGYRTVDPLAYGGGDRPLRDVRRSKR